MSTNPRYVYDAESCELDLLESLPEHPSLLETMRFIADLREDDAKEYALWANLPAIQLRREMTAFAREMIERRHHLRILRRAKV